VPPNLLASPTQNPPALSGLLSRERLAYSSGSLSGDAAGVFHQAIDGPRDVVSRSVSGSCVTGEAAEYTMRRWMCCEIEKTYLEGALARFEERPERKSKQIFYQISSPCAYRWTNKRYFCQKMEPASPRASAQPHAKERRYMC